VTTRFEARDLKPYLDYVESADLVQGELYFALQFLDEDMLIPELRPVVFVGRDCEPGDAGVLYFRDVETYVDGVSDGFGPGSASFDSIPEGSPFVCEFEQVLDGLLTCSLRRSGSLSRSVNAAASLCFEARELPSKTAVLEHATFVENETYYLLGFMERDLLTPELRPVVSVGRDLDGSDSGWEYFQDAESHRQGIRYHTGGGTARFDRFPKEDPSAWTFEDALDELLRCSLRRAGKA
jgi:hypothetical protein